MLAVVLRVGVDVVVCPGDGEGDGGDVDDLDVGDDVVEKYKTPAGLSEAMIVCSPADKVGGCVCVYVRVCACVRAA